MCGIAGIINFSGPEDKQDLLAKMIGMLRHRGPDASGMYLNGPAGLAHARLSIIDLSGGDQPISNEDQTIWIVFNGEIFNYTELRNDLIHKGHRFRTQSDTEVLVHMYEENGTAMFDELNGQFAFAIWDTNKESLMLGRDRVGIRPLFYHLRDSRIIFGSEIKSIFADANIERHLDPTVLSEIFTSWTAMNAGTPFKGVQQLPPGHYAEFSNEGLKIEPYWQLSFDQTEIKERDLSEYVDEFRSLILDAARIRLRADVPVGAYLSGGIDSTYISSMVKRNFNNKLSTFSVTFTDNRFDEASFQQTAIDSLNTEHHEIKCTESDIGHAFPNVIWHTETPIFRTAPTPLYRLSKLVRDNNFKVVLTGEGADEMLAGYNIFKEDRVRRFWAKDPGSNLRPALLAKLYPYIFDRAEARSMKFLEKFFKKNLTETESPFYSHLLRWENTAQIQKFFASEFRKKTLPFEEFIENFRASLPETYLSWHPLQRAQYTEISLFLSNYLLSSQGDRMAMANSIEGRYPFLDHRVIEFAAKLPPRFKLNGLTEKYILKKAARGTIPPELIDRPKQPYRAPISRSFFGDERLEYVTEMLSVDKIRNYGYFDASRVSSLKKKCEKGGGQLLSERENMAVVGILSTQLLHHHFIENFPAYPVNESPNMKVYN